VVRTMKLHK